LLNHFAKNNRLLHGAMLTTIPIFIITIGIGTYSRNAVWQSEESLWTDTLSKAPDNARPFAKLGEIYGWQKEKNSENLKISIALLQKALNLESPRTSFKAAIVGNIGKVYRNYGMLEQSAEYFNESLQLNPDFISSRFDLAETYTLQGKFVQALEQIDMVIAKNDQQSRFFNLKALILLRLDRPEEAVICTQQAMHKTFFNKERYFYNTGVSLTRAGYFDNGRWFLKRALNQSPNDARVICSLIENSLLAGDANEASTIALQLLNQQGITSLKENLKNLRSEYSSVPINVDLISETIIESAKSTVAKLKM
jgi:Tfp pilus assembly protein PilF